MTIDKNTELLFYKFSHELRNPLTSLYSTIQFLELKHPEVKDFKYWPALSYDIEHMNQLIDEWSTLSKSEDLKLETFNFRHFLEQLSLSFAASIAHTDIEYTSKIDSSIHQITGDKTKLQEVFFNLLKNAYEAAKPDNSIYLAAFCSAEGIYIIISDTGCGISSDLLPTIFDPFVTYKKGGTGLGLPICRQIITAHGGTIEVNSSEGCGTTFQILLKTKQKSNHKTCE